MIDSQVGRVGYNHRISNKRKWNNCFIKNNHEILLDLTDFAVPEQPADNLMVAISQPWYNGSHTMAAKPIKSLELHYTMIQFLIIGIITSHVACAEGNENIKLILDEISQKNLVNNVKYFTSLYWADLYFV